MRGVCFAFFYIKRGDKRATKAAFQKNLFTKSDLLCIIEWYKKIGAISSIG